MGTVPNITHEKFPDQGNWLGYTCQVVFHYDLDHRLSGVVVRDDAEMPGVGIIRLDDGRHVLMKECHWSPQDKPDEATVQFLQGRGR